MPDSNIPNRLINEKSPYLLQHAYNPVNWYPWGDEAFEKARIEDKPIFLSVGYSTCHWCHVMENESFIDEGIARVLNRDFVAVKVDREERPDVDSVYMAVCQALTGSGGWPMTIIMDSEKAPFYSATYLPKRSRYGMLGLQELLTKITELWRGDKSRLLETGEEIKAFLNKPQSLNRTNSKSSLDKDTLGKAVKAYENSFDDIWGGFDGAPKFPSPHNLLFLLGYFEKEENKKALQMAEKTLQSMYRGGIFDHIGGGFSRYSTDEKWLIPHFEKMLYDNALLALAYMEAFRITGDSLYGRVAERVLLYVAKELVSDGNGGFYCGQDADSDGVEGKFYSFDRSEIISVLGSDAGNEFCKVYGITEQGNFEGKNIPNLINGSFDVAESPPIAAAREKLYLYRLSRAALHKDDKVLVSWNGLMITAFARAYKVLGNNEYLETAKKAEAFISEKLMSGNRLMVRYRDKNSAGTGTLDDYVFYALGLLELYGADFNAHYLAKACMFADSLLEHFFDTKHGGFYLYADDAEQLISRPKETYDGAMPSGNSTAVCLLNKLARLTGDVKWQECLDKQLNFLSKAVNLYPMGYGFALYSLCEVFYEKRELVCVLTEDFDFRLLVSVAVKNPDLSIIVKTPENAHVLEKAAPFTKSYKIDKNTGNLFYLCAGNNCKPPVKRFEELNLI